MCMQALRSAHDTADELERQQAELQQERMRTLAWTGRALLGSTLSGMLEARTLIRTAFLLPSAQMQCAPHHKLVATACFIHIFSRAGHWLCTAPCCAVLSCSL